MKKIIIAIDGYSSTGKSTIAKRVANTLQYVYIDTGAMYRAVTFLALKRGFISEGKQTLTIDKDSLLIALKQSIIRFEHNPELGVSEIYLNGQNIEKEIRGLSVASYVSEVAKIPEVRAYLVALQREMGREKGVVMDGRDIGTVVFPEAELKIFMTASEEIRAQRRFLELQQKGEVTTYEEVLQNIQKRDYEDTHRKESPLQKALEAIEIDNSSTTIEEVVQEIVSLVRDKK
ncbi:MAG: (d)CMP kinase [Capnocytophaga sp.]|uniref:(d)CMP kinase n=1 Tax=uncultured Capnocytophaga sp. TaxID=159273 RepID=UPI000F2BC1AB|nr:(d)CMP kinase [uncultured Capnocytophaga sp.]RKW08568.1 MAG: (d)CMP kinase [Capnocytophaga sp.]